MLPYTNGIWEHQTISITHPGANSSETVLSAISTRPAGPNALSAALIARTCRKQRLLEHLPMVHQFEVLGR